jgi:phosphate uptake regulator
MLKEIWQALRGKDTLSDMIADVGRMLEAGEWMFERASEALMREADWSAIADELYARDRKVNEIEQSIRERIVTHLSLGHTMDVSACLVLMNVVKDAERIGDYCKNIFEIGKFFRREFATPEFSVPLDEIRRDVLPLFAEARKAFVEAKAGRARDILESASKLRGRCDVLIRQLLSVHDRIAPDEAVAYVLLARFYKRVAAHLANIATSVVSPVPLLDYRGKKLPSTD